MQRHNRLFLLILAWLLTLSACSGIAGGDPTATSVPPTPTFTQPTITFVDGTPQVVIEPVNPTATPDLVNRNPVRITEMQYVQNENRLRIVAKLFNSLNDTILRDVQVEVLALDASGNRVAHEVRTVRYLFPRETTGLVQTFDILPGVVAFSAEVRVKEGLMDRQLKFSQPLNVTNAGWVTAEDGVRLTGWINNRDPYTYTKVELNAIAYNANGAIIGGGRGLIDFVPQKDRTGVSVLAEIQSDQEIALVEIFPWVSGQSASLEGGSWWDNIELQGWNYMVDNFHRLGGGALLRNRTDRLLTETYYLLTVTDQSDKVCLAKEGYIDLIWPKQELVFSPGVLEVPEGCKAEKVDMIIVPGEFGQFQLGYDPLETGTAVVDESGSFASVNVINNLNADLSSAIVYLVVTNASGEIVGGGSVPTGNIRANSAISVDIPIVYFGDIKDLTLTTSVGIPLDVIFGP